MSNAAKYRKKAAEFEQLKQIDRAIASYVKAIEESESAGEDVDVALYNKVGDLALRQGRVPDAITYYERAVEHYATSGLFNNAIALCNKILRNAPGRANVYFTLGRISARKGLRGDATRNFLEYATRMQQDGRIEEGIRALAEVLDLMPELNDVRTMVDDLAARSGIALPRRKTPLRTDRQPTPASNTVVRDQKSQDLVFLDVDYTEASRRTPTRASAIETPAAPDVIPTTVAITPLSAALIVPMDGLEPTAEPIPDFEEMLADGVVDALGTDAPQAPETATAAENEVQLPELLPPSVELVVESQAVPTDIPEALAQPTIVAATPTPLENLGVVALEGLEANGEFVEGERTPVLEGFSPDDVLIPAEDVDPSIHPTDVTWLLPADDDSAVAPLDDVVIEDYEDAANDQGVVRAIYTETPAFVPAVVPDAEIDLHDLTIERLEVESVPELDAAIAAGQELVEQAEAAARLQPLPTPPMVLTPIVPMPMLEVELEAIEELQVDDVVMVPALPIDSPSAVLDIIDEVEEQLEPYRPPFRLDPHDFILPGELPPLVLEDALVDAGLAGAASTTVDETRAAVADALEALSDVSLGAETVEVALSSASPEALVAPGEPTALNDQGTGASDSELVGAVTAESDLDEVDREGDEDAESESEAAPGARRPVSVTPALPIAAVAEVATSVASSRRDALRSAVARLPQNWLLRRRLAEALFEAGERDAALAELETAQTGLVNDGEFVAASDIADELVHVSPDRVGYHQKRVELAVRSNDQQRLRVAYLDLADALVRMAEEGRARAVYARVLEIDPYDDRAREALGPAAPPLPQAKPDDNFVDLADWLRDDDKPVDTRMRMREPAISGDEQADFDSLLRHFKEGVSRSLGEDDFESHYDLGVAYKEMGLLDDAIAEFQKALRSRAHRLPAYEALGQCFVEQGRYQVAATVLSRALHEPGLDDDQRVGVLYLLAYSCEALQRRDEARSYFQRVYATDINFRDVAARLAALEQVSR